MVNVELREGQNPKEEVDVWVVTRGGICMGVDLERGGSYNQNIEGRIKKSGTNTSQVRLRATKEIPA
jgi:hypothetical protein